MSLNFITNYNSLLGAYFDNLYNLSILLREADECEPYVPKEVIREIEETLDWFVRAKKWPNHDR